MADKLSWTELRRAVAARAGVSEKTAGAFLNALTSQLLEGLRTDKSVKINGLGTFKLQGVAPRKSVNVTTGEEIVIPGYNKIAFVPEIGVKELVERGESKVESQKSKDESNEIDPIKKLGEQAEEIVDLLADLGQSPKETAPLKEERPLRKEKEERPLRSKKKEKSEPEPVAEPEPIAEPEPEPVKEPETVAEPEPVEEPVAEPEPEPEPVKEPEKPKKKYHFVRDLLICVVVLLLLLFGGYFFLRSRLTKWIESLAQPKEPTEVVVQPVEEPEPIVEPVVIDTVVPEPEPIVEPEPEPEPYSDLITIEEMHEASRLTWMAKRYYGDKKYWPYLYDANRDVITNPSRIKVGTPIRIPKLTKEQRDTTNAETKAHLEALRIEAEEACRRK